MNSLNNTCCKICGNPSRYIFSKIVMQKYEVKYLECLNCSFVQTEDPYWLDEAYKKSINDSDTGILVRNHLLSTLTSNYINTCLDKEKIFLDYAGGYGIFVRLMRDLGFDFYWDDPYTPNVFAKGFERNLTLKFFEALTIFEAFEHFVNPAIEAKKLFSMTDTLIFSTHLRPPNFKNMEKWWYLSPHHGQHISFYSKKSLEYLGLQNGCKLLTNGVNFHVLTKRNVGNIRFGISTFPIIRKLLFIFFKLYMNSKTKSDMNFLSKA